MIGKYMHPREKYQAIVDEWLGREDIGEATKSILQQGLWCCKNPEDTHGGILIAGINPSYPEDRAAEPVDCEFKCTEDEEGRNYWRTKHDMVRGLNIPTAYIDLFPLRITKQRKMMNDGVIPLDLKVALLQVTQQCIEAIHPRLIINPNMSSSVYWGLNDRFSWMGYDMEPVDNPTGKGQLYIIRGIKGKDDVICPGMDTNLKGTYFLQYKYHDGYRVLKREQFLNSKDVEVLWNYGR